MRGENVDVVEEHAQWMDENSNAPLTMDSQVLAMDLTHALFVHVSLTDLSWSHGGTLQKRDQNQRVDNIGMVETCLAVERAWRLYLP